MGFFSFLGGLFGIGPTHRTITISKSATNSGLPFIIGEARLKGMPVYTHISRENGPLTGNNWDFKFDPRPSHGDEERKSKREWLHRIDVYAQGAITGYETFFVDSDPHTSARFGTRPYFRTAGFYGSDTQTAFQWGSVTSARGSAHPGVGVAYSVSRFYAHGKYPKYKSEPAIEAILQGSALFDPREVTHVAGDETTYDYSENPALGLLRYLTAEAGAGWPFANLHLDSFEAAAEFCDDQVPIPARLTNTTGTNQSRRNIFTGIFNTINDGDAWPDFRRFQVGTTQSRIKGSLVLGPENGMKGNAKDILEVMHASLPFSNGQYKLVIEDAVSSTVMAFDDDSIIGNWKIDDGGRKSRMNRATVNFINKNKNYKDDSVSWPSLGSADYTAYLAADNGKKLHQTFDVDAIPDFYQAQAWAEFKVRRSRASRRVKVDLAPVAMLLEYGDVISITSTERGWSDEWYRVERLILKASGDVTVDLIEYDASLYSWVEPATEPLDDPGDAPFLWDDPIAVAGLAAEAFHEAKNDGTVISGFDVSWEVPEDISKIEAIEIAWKLSADADYTNISGVASENTAVRLPGLVDNQNYDIRITYRTSLGQVSADAEITTQNLDDAGSRISGIADGAQVNAALVLIPDGEASVSGNSITKTSAVDAWNAEAYSDNRYVGSFYVAFTANATNLRFMAGAIADPTVDDDYNDLEFTWYCINSGLAAVYEDGVAVAGSWAYTTATVFAIKWDGVSVEYLMDGVVRHTSVKVPASDDPFYFDSTLRDQNAQINNILFSSGPTTPAWSEVVDDDGNMPEDNATQGDPYAAAENLAGLLALGEHTYASSYSYINESVGPSVTSLGLAVGDVISLSLDGKTDGTAGEAFTPHILFYNVSKAFIAPGNYNPANYASTSFERRSITATIPVGAVWMRVGGAAWGGSAGTKTIKRAMLNRGPVALPYVAPYVDGADGTSVNLQDAITLRGLPPNVIMDQGDDIYRRIPMGIARKFCRNGVVETFTNAWDGSNLPEIRFLPGGLGYSTDGSLTGDQTVSYKALSLTASGFTPELVIKGTSSTLTPRTESAITTVTAGEEYTATKIDSALEAYDDNYIFRFDIQVNGVWDIIAKRWAIGSITLAFDTNTAGATPTWVQRATASYHSEPFSSSSLLTNLTKTITVDGLGSLSGPVFRIRVVAEDNAISHIDAFDNVTYETEASTPAEVTATPAGVPDVAYEVLGGLDNV